MNDKAPIRVAVTGAAGQIGYSLLFRIASGGLFGPDQPVALNLIEIEPGMKALEGVVMELEDGAFPLLKDIRPTCDINEGFSGANWSLLVGSVPRKAGMERGDLLGINGKIFTGQGQAIQNNAAADARILVVGNPCNTNCLIAMNNAPDIPQDRWFAMTRLDENRAAAQLAGKAGVQVSEVSNATIWGNHSATQYPDYYNAKIGGQSAPDAISDDTGSRFHSDRPTTRCRHHSGPGRILGRLGGQRRHRHGSLPRQSDPGGRLEQRLRGFGRELWHQGRAHHFFPGPFGR